RIWRWSWRCRRLEKGSYEESPVPSRDRKGADPTRMKKIRVAVLFGGRSGEHEVSLRSAVSVVAAIDKRKYEVVPIAIAKSGKWLPPKESAKMLPEPLPSGDRSERALTILPEPGSAGAFDVVFPVLHGTFGEDGTVQ